LSKGLFEVGGDGVELFLEGGFSTFEGVEVDSDGSDHVLHHSSNSVDGRLVNKDIFLRGGHLGEEGDDWSVGVHDVDHGTGLDEVHGVGGELDEGSFTSNEFIKEVDGFTEDHDGVLMSTLLSEEGFMLGVSDVGELSKGSLGINLVLLVDGEVVLSSGEGGAQVLWWDSALL